MDTKIITDKGVSWIVCADGSIYTPERTSKITRDRNGEPETFSVTYKQKLAKPWIQKGYKLVSVSINNKRVKFFVHRLVAMAFVDGYSPELSVNHINGDKLDNRPENLEWITLAENTKHQWKTGLVDLRGENSPTHKLSQNQVIHIRKALRAGVSANSLSIIAGVDPSTIYLIEKGKRWKHLLDEPIS